MRSESARLLRALSEFKSICRGGACPARSPPNPPYPNPLISPTISNGIQVNRSPSPVRRERVRFMLCPLYDHITPFQGQLDHADWRIYPADRNGVGGTWLLLFGVFALCFSLSLVLLASLAVQIAFTAYFPPSPRSTAAPTRSEAHAACGSPADFAAFPRKMPRPHR